MTFNAFDSLMQLKESLYHVAVNVQDNRRRLNDEGFLSP